VLARIDRAVQWVTEAGAAVLVVVEIAILFAGVVARYAFDPPLVWVEELAAILFLWRSPGFPMPRSRRRS
jgi:TRAP-type C4-dicarboxylate transport system permease small subunit